MVSQVSIRFLNNPCICPAHFQHVVRCRVPVKDNIHGFARDPCPRCLPNGAQPETFPHGYRDVHCLASLFVQRI